jgi:hypothetical protein
MSALTGNQIKNTYQGLLKLEDSSTGITQNLQAVQDGLGNDTGLRLAQGQLESDNIASFVPLKAQYYGNGFANAAGLQMAAGTQNIIIGVPFYDNGNYAYSAITLNTQTQTSTSDTFQAALYTSQLINPNGLYPHTPIISGITADTTTTGLKTFVFPTDISMSGYGAGIYFLVYRVSNGGVQPTWRPGAANNSIANGFSIYGATASLTTNTYTLGSIRSNGGVANHMVFSGLTTFNNPYANNIDTLQSSTATIQLNSAGFILHTVGA